MIFDYNHSKPIYRNSVVDELQRLAQAVRVNHGNEPRHYDSWFEDDQVAEEQRALAQNEAAAIRSAVMAAAVSSSDQIPDFVQQEIASMDQSRYWATDQEMDNNRANEESPFEPIAVDSMGPEPHSAMNLEGIIEQGFNEMAMNGPIPEPMEDQAMQDMQGMGMPPQM